MLSGAIDETYQGKRLDEVLVGDLVAVTGNGDVFRINPEKLGEAQHHIGDELAGVIETQAKFKVERETTAAFWTEVRAENAEARAAGSAAFEGDRTLHQQAAAAERGVETAFEAGGSAVEAGLDAASGFGSKLAKAFEKTFAMVFGWAMAEPKQTLQQMRQARAAETNEETLHARAYADHVQQTENERDDRIFAQGRQQQEEKRQAEMGFADQFGTPPPSRAKEREENERELGRDL